MAKLGRIVAVMGLAALVGLGTGCASAAFTSQEEAEAWYDEHPVAGVLVGPVDLALGIPVHVLLFVFQNFDELLEIHKALDEEGVY
jgi:hypothetical protein